MSQEINLLRNARPKRAFSATSANGLALVIVAAAALSMCMAVYESYRLGGVEAKAAVVEREVKEARDQLQKATAERKAARPDGAQDARLAELDGQLTGRLQVLDALKSGIVGTTAGFSDYMLAFSRQSLAGVWLTAFDVANGGTDLTLAGRALQADLIPAYLQRLTQEAPLQGRRFASVAITQPPREKVAADADAAKAPARRGLVFVEFEISSAVPDQQPAVGMPKEAAR